jgi:hypothetical protein
MRAGQRGHPGVARRATPLPRAPNAPLVNVRLTPPWPLWGGDTGRLLSTDGWSAGWTAGGEGSLDLHSSGVRYRHRGAPLDPPPALYSPGLVPAAILACVASW